MKLIPYAGQEHEESQEPRPQRILRAFRAGSDTSRIASRLTIPEAVVERELHEARAIEQRNNNGGSDA